MARGVREIGERRLYAIVAVLALLILFLVAFVVKNARDVRVSFVVFDAPAPLIAVMVGCARLGLMIGVGLVLAFQHTRTMVRGGEAAADAPAEVASGGPRRV